MAKRGPKPGYVAPVSYAARCPHCAVRYVNIHAHVRKCKAIGRAR